jgi:DNA-binding CsgD family transcriptional regulator
MKCRTCNSSNTRVTCTDHFPTFTKRYCRCLDCGTKYRTVEHYENPKPGPPKGSTRGGNIARGSAHGAAVLTEKDVLQIRRLHQEGKTYKVIAQKYGISVPYVSKLVKFKSWKHLTQP